MGLNWHYDVTGAEPIIRDTRVYNSGALSMGQAMCSGPVATVENGGCAIVADDDVLSNIIGVLNEDLTAAQALSVVATGVDKYAKLIINPFAVWLGKYQQAAATDIINTVATSTGKALTITQVTNHHRGWAYVTNIGGTTGGFGNLFQIGAITGTTVVTAATDYDDHLSAVTTSDTVIILHPPYNADVAGGSVNLVSSATLGSELMGMGQGAGAGAAIVIENYIKSNSRPLEMLRAERHSGYNYKAEAPDFYGDLMFSEHLLACGGVVNDRVIT